MPINKINIILLCYFTPTKRPPNALTFAAFLLVRIKNQDQTIFNEDAI